ncbi:MAG: replication-relaxation family protein [Chloroflexi bacterium]|nr:replication-relaxation family protein [Chloroflexota bacterium]
MGSRQSRQGRGRPSARGRGGSRLRNLRRNLAHTVGVNVFFGQLTADAHRLGHELPHWWSEAEATQRFRHHDDRTYWVRPDGAGLYYLGERTEPFMLEYDRGTMRRRDYLRKLAGIAAYFEGEHYRGFFDAEPTMLVVAEHDAAEQRFISAVQSADLRFGVEIPALFTTRSRYDRNPRNPDGALGPIWRALYSETRFHWLDDLDE